MSDLAQHIDTVESGYEFLLAYAAQGRLDDDPKAPGPRARNILEAMQAALDAIRSILDTAATPFHKLVREDIHKAQAVIAVVLGARVLSSDIVDNLNASIHLRTLLTDLFLLDADRAGQTSAPPGG